MSLVKDEIRERMRNIYQLAIYFCFNEIPAMPIRRAHLLETQIARTAPAPPGTPVQARVIINSYETNLYGIAPGSGCVRAASGA